MPSGKQIGSQGPTPLMSHKNLPLLQFYIIWVNHILSQLCKENIMVWVWNVSHKLLRLSPTPTPQKLVVPVFIGSFVCLVGLVWLFIGGGRQSFPKGTTSWGQRGEPCSWIAGPHFLFMFTSWSANILGNNPVLWLQPWAVLVFSQSMGPTSPFFSWLVLVRYVVGYTREREWSNSFKFQIRQLIKQAATVPEPQTCA